MWYVYLLRCVDGSTYTGSASDVVARFAAHQQGRGAQYTRLHAVDTIVSAVPIGTRAQAGRFERQVKRWSASRKVEFFQAFAGTWRTMCGAAETTHPPGEVAQVVDALRIQQAAQTRLTAA